MSMGSLTEEQQAMLLQAMMGGPGGPTSITPQARADGYDELKRRLTVFTFFVVAARFVLPPLANALLK